MRSISPNGRRETDEHMRRDSRAEKWAGDGAKRHKPPIKNAFSMFDTLESRSREPPWQDVEDFSIITERESRQKCV
ncbi:unnamed protein product [Lota lota]